MLRNNNLKNVIVYCRESRDDGFENYDRIETQRDILVDFCKKQNLGNIIEIVMDDNKTGTSFERLLPIKEKIRRKEVDILLCKDASRLGRNILESLTFTEFLTTHKVELIFESERYDEDMFPLIAWFNERRVKDDSTKIRRVLKHKMEEGTMIIKAPYGYIKDGNCLKIDLNIAPVIQEIFELYVNGKGMYEIATIINKKGYPTPSQLKSQYENTNRTHIWNKQHVDRILKHMIYTGDMPYGMREKVSYKSSKYVNKDRSDWIIVVDHHEPIISKDIYEQAQAKMKRNIRTQPRTSRDKTFSGMLFCGRCGSRLVKKERKNKPCSYVCGKSDREGAVKDDIKESYGCTTHRMRETDIVCMVEQYIEKLMHDEQFRKKLFNELDNSDTVRGDLSKQIKFCENKISELQKKASLVYDDKLNGSIPEFLFQEKLATISKQLNEYEAKLADYSKTFDSLEDASDSKHTIDSIVAEIRRTSIHYDNISMLFKKIIVFNAGDISEEHKGEYSLSDDEFEHMKLNGGILFIQNFVYHHTLMGFELVV